MPDGIFVLNKKAENFSSAFIAYFPYLKTKQVF